MAIFSEINSLNTRLQPQIERVRGVPEQSPDMTRREGVKEKCRELLETPRRHAYPSAKTVDPEAKGDLDETRGSKDHDASASAPSRVSARERRSIAIPSKHILVATAESIHHAD